MLEVAFQIEADLFSLATSEGAGATPGHDFRRSHRAFVFDAYRSRPRQRLQRGPQRGTITDEIRHGRPAARRTQALRQQFGLGGFAGALATLQGDETAAHPPKTMIITLSSALPTATAFGPTGFLLQWSVQPVRNYRVLRSPTPGFESYSVPGSVLSNAAPTQSFLDTTLLPGQAARMFYRLELAP